MYARRPAGTNLLLGHKLDERPLLGVDAVLLKLLVREALEAVLEEVEPRRGAARGQLSGSKKAKQESKDALDPLLVKGKSERLEVKVVRGRVDGRRCRRVCNNDKRGQFSSADS